MSTEIRKLNKEGVDFYPLTHEDAVVGNDGRTIGQKIATVDYDISANHSGATYADLATALGTDGANVPSTIRKGGISIKFVLSSDNKYVQYRYMGTSTTNADFANVANWQGVDDEPIAGSDNLVKSGGVKEEFIAQTGGLTSIQASEIYPSSKIVASTGAVDTGSGTVIDVAISTGIDKLYLSGYKPSSAANAFAAFFNGTTFLSAIVPTSSEHIIRDYSVDVPYNATLVRVFGNAQIEACVKKNVLLLKDRVLELENTVGVTEAEYVSIYGGKAISLSNGDLTDATSNACVKECNIQPNVDCIIKTYNPASNSLASIAFYNGVTFIEARKVGEAGTYSEVSIEIPENATSIKVFSTVIAPAIFWKKNPQKFIDELSVGQDVLNNEIHNNYNSTNIEGTVEVGVLKTDGSVGTSTDSRVLTFNCDGSKKLSVSGYTPGSTNYVSIAYFNSSDVLIRTELLSNHYASFTNVVIVTPSETSYVKLNGNVATVEPSARLLEDTIKGRVDNIENRVNIIEPSSNLYPQIKQKPLPQKGQNETLRILLIGSSWGVDTISALSDIANNLGISIETGDMYKSGGTIIDYLELVEQEGTATFYFNSGSQKQDLGQQTVEYALNYKNWDIIVLMTGASMSQYVVDTPGINSDVAKWVQYLSINCPNAVLAVNSTWTSKDAQNTQDIALKTIGHLIRQSGIDVIVPSGASIVYLRGTQVNDGNDIYRDSMHLNVGVGRFTAACAAYMSLIYPIYKIPLSSCTLTGKWDTQGIVQNTYPIIEVSNSNRDICIDCAIKANSDRFLYAL